MLRYAFIIVTFITVYSSFLTSSFALCLATTVNLAPSNNSCIDVAEANVPVVGVFHSAGEVNDATLPLLVPASPILHCTCGCDDNVLAVWENPPVRTGHEKVCYSIMRVNENKFLFVLQFIQVHIDAALSTDPGLSSANPFTNPYLYGVSVGVNISAAHKRSLLVLACSIFMMLYNLLCTSASRLWIFSTGLRKGKMIQHIIRCLIHNFLYFLLTRRK